jgi:hypothetical protein
MKKLVPRSTVEITNTVSVQKPVFVVGRVVVQQLENKSQAGDTKQEYREVNFSVVSQLMPSFGIRSVRVKLQMFSMTRKKMFCSDVLGIRTKLLDGRRTGVTVLFPAKTRYSFFLSQLFQAGSGGHPASY